MRKNLSCVIMVFVALSTIFSYVGVLYTPNNTVQFDHEPGFQSTIRTFLAEQPLTMFDNLFGTTTYFNDLKNYDKLSQIYKETLKEILLLSSLDPSISLVSRVYEEVKKKGGLVGDTAQAMQAVFEIYRATVDNRYISSDTQYAELLNGLKRFGRMDTKVSATWNSVAQKATIASEILKWSKYPLLLNSVRGYMLSMDFAYDRALLTANAVNEYRRTGEVGPLFQNALSDVLREMNTWMDSSSMEQFVNAYIAQINELDLARDITTTVAAKSLKTAVATAEMPVLPAIGWGFAIKFSIDTILSGVSAQDIFNRYLVAGDILHWLRKMRENTPQGTQQHLELAIMELYCQMYAAELGRDFFGERVQQFVVWRSSARREVVESFEKDVSVAKDFLQQLFEADPVIKDLAKLYCDGASSDSEETSHFHGVLGMPWAASVKIHASPTGSWPFQLTSGIIPIDGERFLDEYLNPITDLDFGSLQTRGVKKVEVTFFDALYARVEGCWLRVALMVKDRSGKETITVVPGVRITRKTVTIESGLGSHCSMCSGEHYISVSVWLGYEHGIGRFDELLWVFTGEEWAPLYRR